MPTEHEYQCKVITWFTRQHKVLGVPDARALYAVPNAQILMRSARNVNAVLSYLMAEGMRKGPPDLNLDVMRKGYGGLRIEMKRGEDGVLSAEQVWYQNYLNGAGYKAVVCRSDMEAINAIKSYLGRE
jgi:hypothetical protein